MDEWQSEIQKKLADILREWEYCAKTIKVIFTDKKRLEFSKIISSNFSHKDFTFENIDEQLRFTFNLLREIVGSKDAYLIPNSSLGKLEENLNTLQGKVQKFYTFFLGFHDKDESMVFSIDDEMILSYQSRRQVDMRTGRRGKKVFLNLVNEIIELALYNEALLDVCSHIANIIKKSVAPKSQNYIKKAEALIAQIADMQNRIEKEYKASRPLYRETAHLQEQIKRDNEQIKNILNEMAQISITFANDKAVIEERKADITAISDSAEKLRAKINSHESELEGADEKRKELETDMDKTIAKVDVLLASVEDANKRAKSMLGLATSVELSTKFQTREKSINSQFFWAQIIHFFILILFIIYTLSIFSPLGVHLKLLEEPFVPNTMEFKTLLFKFTLIFPFLLLMGFTNRRYKELFKLKEHYAYKDSIAVSIPSFKEQAGDYGDLVATTLFSKLTFNPADDIGKSKEKNADILTENEPLYKTAFDAMEKRVKAIGGEKMTDTIKANDTTEINNANDTTKANSTTKDN